tara:strand:+ start:2178 stop:2867 length:690 start_codon:yes stop_codon:yes gene_type:complete
MTTKQPSTLSEALAIFQSQVKAADKNGKAKFPQPRTYSLLEDVLKALQPATELGISHTQTFDYLPLEDGKTLTVLITTLYFKNEKLESKLPLRELSGNNVYHDLGIAITYSRRYALAAAYGIGSEHDDDAVALTQPPAKEKGTDRTHTKAKQKLEPVSEQAKKNPPITTEARNLITDQLKQLMETNPDKAKEIAAAFITEFKVPRVTGFITEARHGEFLSHAISKIADD